jgi:UDP-N-acetylglucosamine/UDP-N-acetylgalactosamine diphosphorylase
VLGDGRTQVLEYSDMPKHLQEARDEQGNLRYSAGSVAIHMLSRSFVEKLATDEKFELPWHRAEKKIPCIDPISGASISPTTNNGVKLEKFIFDALPLCDKSLVMEVSRTEEFAPIKNATGTDSVESSKQLQTLRASNWLQACGIKIPKKPDGSPDCTIEISPRTATSPEELAASLRKLAALPAFTAGSRIAL